MAGFRHIYPNYNLQQEDLSGQHQRLMLPVILQAAQQSEEELSAIQEIAWSAVGQAFASSGSALASQAETKLLSYQKSPATDRDGRKKPECFGCGGDHPWMVNGEIK